MKMTKHPSNMSIEELRDLVSEMSFAALDLCQHLNFVNEYLKEEYKESAYKKAAEMANKICEMPYSEIRKQQNIDIALFGDDGLSKF